MLYAPRCNISFCDPIGIPRVVLSTSTTPFVVDMLNTTLAILMGSQNLIVQRGAYTTSKLVQNTSHKDQVSYLDN